MGKYRIFILLVSMVLMLPLSEILKKELRPFETATEQAAPEVNENVDRIVPEGGAVSAPVAAADAPKAVVPVIFTGSVYLYICGIMLLAFALLFTFAVISGRILMLPALYCGFIIFVAFWALLGLGMLAVNLASGIFGLAAYIGAPALIAVIYLLIFFLLKKRSVIAITSNSVRRSAFSAGAVKYDLKVLYGAMTAVVVLAVIAWFAGEKSYYLMIPFACACVGLLLWRLLKWRFFLLLGFLAIELFILIYCIPVISMGVDVAFWRVLVLSLLYLSLLTPLGDLYCHREAIV